jgi:hypothetical protein
MAAVQPPNSLLPSLALWRQRSSSHFFSELAAAKTAVNNLPHFWRLASSYSSNLSYDIKNISILLIPLQVGGGLRWSFLQ